MIDIMREHYTEALPEYKRSRKESVIWKWGTTVLMAIFIVLMLITLISGLISGALTALIMLIPLAMIVVGGVILWNLWTDLTVRWDKMIAEAEDYLAVNG